MPASLFTRAAAVAALALIGLPARADLPIGAKAPAFVTEAALGGKASTFSMADALRKGPVVLYFFPKAFTSGCTVEAHAFAEATPEFQQLGATVIGMSSDSIETLKKFSVEACRSQFAVAADPGGRVIRQYDAGILLMPDVADRVSYLVSPAGKVIAHHASMNPESHVSQMLDAVRRWRQQQPR
ncbi:peroxiredoxin [Sphaerotilus hippei]|uniref:thioredoxin-dependent peroxiredoxin n=1 Tax=Sphaerotilus hippei TaxID=744406 RepID=A0A318GXE6_9BURK|nr:peroxiredoxin [Sphaerotilus hippei]PXW92792.1 peroxiredoxin [Sphaerotilus hippei]